MGRIGGWNEKVSARVGRGADTGLHPWTPAMPDDKLNPMMKGFLRRLVALAAAYALACHAALPALLVSLAAPLAPSASEAGVLTIICSAGHQDTAYVSGPSEARYPARDQAPPGIPPCHGDVACAMAGCTLTATLRESPSATRPAGVAAWFAPRLIIAEPRAQTLAGTNLARGPPAG
jgi:hypothetical protein